MKDRILMLVFVLVLGGLLTSALVIVDDFTAPMIERNAAIKLQSSVLDALGIPYESDTLEATFQRSVTTVEADGRTYYRTADGRLALPYDGSGLWGPIEGILAMDQNLTEIKGLTIMQQEETPGLGSRITEASYLNQFLDKQIRPLVPVAPGKSSANNEVDTISGATLSSKAFVKILNDEYQAYVSVVKDGK